MFKRVLVFTTLMFVLCGLSGNLSAKNSKEEEVLRFGISATVSPKDTVNTYQEMIYYVGEKLGISVEIVQRKTYEEMDKLLEKGNVKAAFICGGSYVVDHDAFGAELLAAPQAYGGNVYCSYIIVSKDSPIEKFEDLRGKRFAFTDPNGTTGYISPVYMLSKMNESPESFFSEHIFSGHHGNSIKLVAGREIDGASVENLVWEYLNAYEPALTSKTKIILKSDSYGIAPIVVSPSIDIGLKMRIRDIFLNMHKDEYGKKILEKVFIDKFVVPDDKDYDGIREMKKWINKKEK